MLDILTANIRIDAETNCWLWTGTIRSGGYGRWPGEKGSLAHRVSYELHRGPIPAGMQIDHLCRIRHCVNPDHLEPVTHAQNARRGAFATKTHCSNGHPYDAENTYIDKTGSRKCRACDRESYWRRRDRVREQRMEFRARRKAAVERGEPVPKIVRELTTHCIHGHPLDAENLYLTPKGKRVCRECKRIAFRKADELLRANLAADPLYRGAEPAPEIASPGELEMRSHEQTAPPPPTPKSTHCPNGHLYDDTHRGNDGFRRCRACQRDASRRVREKQPKKERVCIVRTHCAHGHLMDEANTYMHPDGGRVCRACNRAHALAWKARKALAAIHNGEREVGAA